ncbi:MAG: hypothetical protein HC924_14265 [Synechococcaceae cyanobacterium SM2_3_2]|nr:hypothetical protein [Synechococcaceae cyanobacterium SM2_3_2]
MESQLMPNLTEAGYEQLTQEATRPGLLGIIARRALAMLKAEAQSQSDGLAPGAVSPDRSQSGSLSAP